LSRQAWLLKAGAAAAWAARVAAPPHALAQQARARLDAAATARAAAAKATPAQVPTRVESKHDHQRV